MKAMVWGPELETGIDEIDKQHRRIVDLVNMMQEARLTKDIQAVGNVITEMVDYTISHFEFEEALMEDSQYRFKGPHKRVHELFTRKIPEFQARFEAGEDISEELHTMLVRWLYNHIKNDDQGYVEAVKTHFKDSALPPFREEEMKAQIKSELLEELHQKKRPSLWRRLWRAIFPA